MDKHSPDPLKDRTEDSVPPSPSQRSETLSLSVRWGRSPEEQVMKELGEQKCWSGGAAGLRNMKSNKTLSGVKTHTEQHRPLCVAHST